MIKEGEEFSPGQLLRDYVRRQGWGDVATASAALELVIEHDPHLATWLIETRRQDTMEWWPEVLDEPASTYVTEDGMLALTEHGERLAERARREGLG